MLKHHQLTVVESLLNTMCLHWWRIVQQLGRVHVDDLYGTHADVVTADISLFKLCGLVTFQEIDGETYVLNEPDSTKLINFSQFMQFTPKEVYPRTFTESESLVISMVESYGMLPVHLIKENIPSAGIATRSLLEKKLILGNGTHFVLRFTGNERHNVYDVTRTKCLDIQTRNTRWATVSNGKEF